jgi:hypothetical protein
MNKFIKLARGTYDLFLLLLKYIAMQVNSKSIRGFSLFSKRTYLYRSFAILTSKYFFLPKTISKEIGFQERQQYLTFEN